ncbi:YciI family protein [Deinococcus cellulosilyticus]|uniref:YCII-related domain-containing protein n=1 Tax=Deinococcus cellulosilyticus (strain DSM 18568 / NBRC 106333 / KACC 11606 / 5516J-15) TaxID=1223518 RepID=A0A511N914_DEIC1|nr:YciI family protein [Deinococcus cellulosilyticus]GEM48871.1 hypothetical protein DC3_45060 [Deinococcus cellulosilyticus NBRC 106333 = KACC 11606]
MSENLFVLIVKYIRPSAEVEARRVEHREWLDVYYRQGRFLVSGPQVPRDGGIILAKGGTKADWEKIAQEDPFVTSGVAVYEVIEFEPVKRHGSLNLPDVPAVQ